MVSKWSLAISAAALILAAGVQGCQPGSQAGPGVYQLNLSGVKEGELPKGWKADATNPNGEIAQWKAAADGKAVNAPKVLSITRIADASKGHFNLCWTDSVRLKDGAITVNIRANSGAIDQGGGLIWRVKNASNYYVARYNPLESNFRLYHVKDGKRTQLADAGGIKIKTGEWFTMKVVANGDKMEAWLGEKKLLEATDQTFPEAGGIGFWTKADAASSFDNLTVEAAQGDAAKRREPHHLQMYSR